MAPGGHISTKIWVALLNNICAKDLPAISKARCKPANGLISKVSEKYTTEVVLQRYRGELTLLGGRGDSANGWRQLCWWRL